MFEFAAGTPARGRHFIGREDLKKYLRSNVLDINPPSNTSIVGLPRSGKTSLVFQLEDMVSKIYPMKPFIFIDTATIDEPNDLFFGILDECIEFLESNSSNCEKIKAFYEKIRKDKEWNSLKKNFLRFFSIAKSCSMEFILCFDEFDAARSLFANCKDGFQTLRALGNNYYKYGVCLVTTSRRNIMQIEYETGDNSNLFGIFNQLDLPFFSDDDIFQFKKIFFDSFQTFSENDFNFFKFYCGNNPYLLCSFARHISILKKNNTFTTINDAFFGISQTFTNYFESILKYLNDYELNDIISDVLQDNPPNPNQKVKFLQLQKYGILQKIDNKITLFSEYFADFYRNIIKSRKNSEVSKNFTFIESLNLVFNSDISVENFTKFLETFNRSERFWLEFKACIIPDADTRKKEGNLPLDQYIWSDLIKPILAITNTMGGVLLIGVEDSSAKFTQDTIQDTDDAIIRKITSYLRKKTFKLNNVTIEIESNLIRFCTIKILHFSSHIVFAIIIEKSAEYIYYSEITNGNFQNPGHHYIVRNIHGNCGECIFISPNELEEFKNSLSSIPIQSLIQNLVKNFS